MANKSEYKLFEELMDVLQYHAGQWHDAGCPFPTEDWGVCNCKLAGNKRTVRSFFKPN